jgi:hypothetical protein
MERRLPKMGMLGARRRQCVGIRLLAKRNSLQPPIADQTGLAATVAKQLLVREPEAA